MSRPKLYKNLTLSERMILFLTTQLEWKEIPSKNKYRMFTRQCKPAGSVEGSLKDFYLFVGKNGAVRSNDCKNASTSYSQTERYQRGLIQYETLNNLMEEK